jgi:hypothetical protein
MFDPGAMGTLLIGLNADREERNERRQLFVAAAPRERPHGVRVAIANGLRRAASLLDQPRVRETSGVGQ